MGDDQTAVTSTKSFRRCSRTAPKVRGGGGGGEGGGESELKAFRVNLRIAKTENNCKLPLRETEEEQGELLPARLA